MSYSSRALGGMILYALARAMGARVTSWRRTAAENVLLGGSPTGAHVEGGAIDVGIETPEVVRAVLRSLSVGPTDGLHQGTAPHYHYTAGSETLLRVAAGIGAGLLIKGAARG
jgi:hypothetical protein